MYTRKAKLICFFDFHLPKCIRSIHCAMLIESVRAHGEKMHVHTLQIRCVEFQPQKMEYVTKIVSNDITTRMHFGQPQYMVCGQLKIY